MFKKLFAPQTNLSTDALEIIFTGAFKTDVFLNFSQTETGDYLKIQEAVKGTLNKMCSGYEWEIPDSGQGQKYEVDALGTGKSLRPSYYIECAINDCKKLTKRSGEFDFLINKIKIKFYEFGFATLSMSIRIVPICSKNNNKEKILPEKLLCIIDKFEEMIVKGNVKEINELICKISEKYKNAIIKENILKFDISEKDSKTAEIKYNVICFHRIFEYGVSKNSKIKAVEGNFEKIAQLSGGKWQTDDCFSHFVGVANSVIIYNSSNICDHSKICSKILERYRNAYKTVLETANAYYFIAEGITENLAKYSRKELALFNKGKREKISIINFCRFIKKYWRKYWPTRKRFEKFDEYILLISNFLSALNEFKLNLNRQGKSVWCRMDKVWSTSEALDILKNQQRDSSLIFDTFSKYNTQTFQLLLNFATAVFAAIGLISLVEIAQSKGLEWEFDGDTIFPNSLDEFVSKPINFIGSALAVALIVTLLCIIFCRIKVFLRRVFDRKKNEYLHNE